MRVYKQELLMVIDGVSSINNKTNSMRWFDKGSKLLNRATDFGSLIYVRGKGESVGIYYEYNGEIIKKFGEIFPANIPEIIEHYKNFISKDGANIGYKFIIDQYASFFEYSEEVTDWIMKRKEIGVDGMVKEIIARLEEYPITMTGETMEEFLNGFAIYLHNYYIKHHQGRSFEQVLANRMKLIITSTGVLKIGSLKALNCLIENENKKVEGQIFYDGYYIA